RYTPVRRYNAAMRDGDWKLVFPSIPGVDAIAEPEGRNLSLVEREEMTYAAALAETPPEPDRTDRAAPSPQLFNLAADPDESSDLAAAEPARVTRMMAALDSWWDAVCSEETRRPRIAPRVEE
ncbi:MAG: hypothetical protein ACRDJN_12070, partial [Chloroflexota bacterium]